MSHIDLDLLAYLDGELSPADATSVEAHLAGCPACTTELNELQALRTGLRTVVPVVYQSVQLPAAAEARVRSALAAERARQNRSGSLQASLAAFWAGLLAGLRPLSKAAIPLVAVFFFGMILSAAQLPMQDGVQQTWVLGQDTLAPGSQAALRVVVNNVADNQPVANAEVAVQMRQAGLAKTVFSGQTDATGSSPVRFEVPDDWQGEAELVVATASELGEDEIVAPIQLQRSYRLLLGSDKPVYQPGETIHLRTLALGTVDSRPAANAVVRFEAFDSNGQRLLSQDQLSSEFGVAAIDLPLAGDVPLGQYQIRATLGDTVSEMSVALGQAPLPTFLVDVQTDASYHLPGDLVSGAVNASYFFGKPVSGAQVAVRLVGEKLGQDPAVGEERLFVSELRGESDAAGDFPFAFQLPDLPPSAFEPDGIVDLALEATVVDSTGDSQFGWQSLALAEQPLLIDVVPEDGVLRAGVENVLYVLTSYPDGQPAATSLEVQIGAGTSIEESTNDYGLAQVRYTPRAGEDLEREVIVRAVDADGRSATDSVLLPLDQARETLVLRTDRALYEVGDTMAVEAIATGSGPVVFLDVIKGGQTLLTQSALVENGRARLAVDLTPALAGTLELNAYQITGDANILSDTRVAVVDEPEAIQVQLTTDQTSYQPGQQAQISVTTSAGDQGVETAVGLSVVNEAVYGQRQYQPGFARAFFLLDESLRAGGVTLSDEPLPGVEESADQARAELREAQQLAAKASWAGYGGQQYSLTAQSVDQVSRGVVNAARQQAFSQISRGISLALVLASLLIATVVLLGLRRSGVLGKALGRLLLTVIALAVFGAGLLIGTQLLLDRLSQSGQLLVLVVASGLWLALLLVLLIQGVRRKDQRIQYVALLLLAYVVLLALLAYAAGQGATLTPAWLMVLALGFGMQLTALLLFGWGLRMEGQKRSGMAVLLLALLALPLMVALNAANLGGTQVIRQVAGPSIYGLSSGLFTGCAAPPAQESAVVPPSEVLQGDVVEAPAEAMGASEEAAPEGTVVMAAVEELQPTGAAAPLPAEEAPSMAAPPPEEEASAAAAPASPVPGDSSGEPAPGEPESSAAAEVGLVVTGDVTSTAALTVTEIVTATMDLAARQVATGSLATEALPPQTLALLTSTVTLTESEALFGVALPTETLSLTATRPLTVAPGLTLTLAEISAKPLVTPTEEAEASAAALAPDLRAQETATPSATATATPSATATPTPSATATPTPSATATPTPASTWTPEPTATPAPEAAAAPPVEASSLPATEDEPVLAAKAVEPAPIPLESLPIVRERFPQTLYWNPQALTDGNGRLQVAIPTGDAITTWRISALAVDRTGRLGSASVPLVVFQPLFVVPNLPGQLSVGEEIIAPVRIFNYSPQDQTVRLSAQASSGLRVEVTGQPVPVPANEAVVVEARIRALAEGPQTITFSVVGDGAQDARQATILVQ